MGIATEKDMNMIMRKEKLFSIIAGLLLVGFSLPSMAQLSERNARNFGSILDGLEQAANNRSTANYDPCTEDENTALPGFNDPANVAWREANCSRPANERPQLASNARWDYEYQTPRQQIAAMLGCDENDPRVQNAVASREDVESARFTPAQVIDEPGEQQPDMRQNLRANDESLFAGIGKIVCSDGRTSHESTATVIGDRNTIISAAHFNLVYDDSKRLIKEYRHSDCTFRATYRDGRGNQQTYTSSLNSPTIGATADDMRRSRYGDWSIFTLDEATPLPRQINPIAVLPLSVPDVASTGTYLVGYAGDMTNPSRRFISSNCKAKAFRMSSRMLEHSCDTGPGTSGALIMTDINGVPHAVGIHLAAGNGNYNIGINFNGALQTALRSRNLRFARRNTGNDNI